MPPNHKQEVIMVDLPSTPVTPTAVKASVAALQRTFASGQGKEPYDVKTALDDLPLVRKALSLFLESKMVESEDLINERDPTKYAYLSKGSKLQLMHYDRERLYCATGYGLIQFVKALMSYEDEVGAELQCLHACTNECTQDLAAAIAIIKHGNQIASQHRKKVSFTSRLTSLVHSPSVSWVKSMNSIERHAELTYAETLFEKAIIGIVYSGDWLQFIKEAYVFSLICI